MQSGLYYVGNGFLGAGESQLLTSSRVKSQADGSRKGEKVKQRINP